MLLGLFVLHADNVGPLITVLSWRVSGSPAKRCRPSMMDALSIAPGNLDLNRLSGVVIFGAFLSLKPPWPQHMCNWQHSKPVSVLALFSMLGILIFLLLTGVPVQVSLFAPLSILTCASGSRYSLHGLVMVSNEDGGEHLDHEGILNCKSNLQAPSLVRDSHQWGRLRN